MTNPIGWCEETWNPITGCTPISEGCRNCYAQRMAKRMAGRFGYDAEHPFRPGTLHPEQLDKPDKWKKPRKIFVCSMGDLFHEAVPDEEIDKVIQEAALCVSGWVPKVEEPEDEEDYTYWPGHTFLLLTKRAGRMRRYINNAHSRFDDWLGECVPGDISDWIHHKGWPLPNLWLGTTVENQDNIGRICHLLETPAAVRYISAEPMLGPLDLEGGPTYPQYGMLRGWHVEPGEQDPDGNWEAVQVKHKAKIDLVICGAENGPGARPMKLEWARDLRDQCREAGVPFWFKGAGPGIETPEDLMIQEWPKERSEA